MATLIATRALFIPLLGIWFDAFARGDKSEEWRRFGKRWNCQTCYPGRAVILSRGYSGARLSAVIDDVTVRPACGPAVALFGQDTPCLVIKLHNIAPLETLKAGRAAS